MNRLNRNYWLNSLFYAVLALALSWVFDQWLYAILGMPLKTMNAYWLLKLFLALLFVAFGYRLKWSLGLVLILGLSWLLTWLLLPGLAEAGWAILESLILNFRNSLYWAFYQTGLMDLMPVMTPLFIACISILISLLVVFVFSNGWLAIALVSVPLFYFPVIVELTNWMGLFILGLAIALVLLFKPTLGRLRHEVLNIPFILSTTFVVSLLTYSLATWIGPQPFYYPTLNEWLTRDQTFNFFDNLDEPFSLFHAGYYGADRQIGGPVVLNHQPALSIEVHERFGAFYLRGPVYNNFDQNRWLYSMRETRHNFTNLSAVNSKSAYFFTNEQALAFNYRSEDLLSEFIELGVFPQMDRLQMIFHTGRPYFIRSVENADDQTFLFTSYGEIYAQPALGREGYLMAGDFFEAFSSNYFHLQEYPLEKQRPSSQRYKGLLDEYDPALSQLVYGSSKSLLDSVIAIVEHFKTNYTYSLDVATIPFGESFVETFLQERSGYCVYYGSFLTLLLQDMGFNARYVEGYVVPQRSNTSDGRRMVTHSSAHAWTEIYFEDIGWYPLDATPAAHLDYLANYQPPSSPLPTDPSPIETLPEIPTLPDETPTPQPTPTPDIGPTTPVETSSEQPAFSSRTLWGGLLWAALFIAGFERLRSYRRRLDVQYLKNQQTKTTQEMIRWIWQDILNISSIDTNLSAKTLTMSQLFDRIAQRYSINDRFIIIKAKQVLIDAYFGDQDPNSEDFGKYLEFYRYVQRRHQRASHALVYFIRRVLGGPHL